uniref:Uncharacterized protein n=1 Tax=Rhizophora mucronata TaxID=61149 RepID=A0A2P2PTC3_RHIMU
MASNLFLTKTWILWTYQVNSCDIEISYQKRVTKCIKT